MIFVSALILVLRSFSGPFFFKESDFQNATPIVIVVINFQPKFLQRFPVIIHSTIICLNFDIKKRRNDSNVNNEKKMQLSGEWLIEKQYGRPFGHLGYAHHLYAIHVLQFDLECHSRVTR